MIFSQNITLFIGENQQNFQPFQIEAFPDFLFNQTVISSNDFQCSDEYDCQIVSDQVYQFEYEGQNLQYKLARTQVNIIKQTFKEKLTIYYLFDDKENFGSVVGFQRNSNFLDYLYRQNKLMDYQIIMRIDWKNRLVFKSGVYETDKLPMDYQMKSTFFYPQDSEIETENLNFCYSNRVYSEQQTYLSIKDSLYQEISSKMNQYYSNLQEQDKLVVDDLQLKNQNEENLMIKLYSDDNQEIASLDLSIDELFDENGNFLVTSFSEEFDEGRNCDVYTSTLILKKYDFKYYYIEYNYNYEVKFGFDNYNPEPSHSYGFGNLLDVILILSVIGLVGYVIYYHFYRDKDEDLDVDEFDIYQEMQQRPSIYINNNSN